MTEEWPAPKFRQSVIAKINEAILNTPQLNDPTKNGTVMEGHLFRKSKNKEEYLGLVSKLLLHFRELKAKQQQQQNPEMNQNQMGGGGPGAVQDPINALQNLTAQGNQGNRNPQMMQQIANQQQQMGAGGPNGPAGNAAASNLLQTLTQQRPQQMQQNMQGIRNQQMPPGGQPIGPGGAAGPNQMNSQIGGPGNFNSTGMNMNNIGNMGPGAGPVAQMQSMQQQNQMQGNTAGQLQPNQGMNPVGPPVSMNQINPNQMGGGPPGANMNQMNPQINQLMQQRIGMGNMGGPNQQQMMNQNQMPNQMQQQQPNQMNPALMNPQGMGPGMNPGPMNPQNQGQLNQMLNMQQMQKNQQNMMVNNPGIFPGNRNVVGQQQFLRQCPSPQVSGMTASPQGAVMNSSPAGMGLQPGSAPGSQQGQMIPSPALVPSPSSQMPNMMGGNQRNLRQSPNGPLNTPGQVTGSSPFNPQEDQMYREKYKQLTKYIEPLKRMVAKIGNDDVEKITKMNKLLEILCNPHQRIPLETLLKCEKALEKMDFKAGSYPFSGSHQFGSNNPLLEAVNSTLQNPVGNHTLQRTFRPCLEALFGTDIKCPIPPRSMKFQLQEEYNFMNGPEIPHVLQGEIARLDQKFKISLDPSATQTNTNIIKLICCIDDKRLPCVPPILVSIDDDYPLSSPTCSLVTQEYSATPFLLAVQNALVARISKLPKSYSLSHLLDTWEMSIRHACSPKAQQKATSIDMALEELAMM